MLSALKPVIYVQLSPERLTVKNPKTGETISEPPEIAISAANQKVIGVGAEARSAATGQQAQVINPFAHPRSMVSDFTSAEQVLKHFLRRIQGNALFAITPIVILHPLGTPAGGYTQVEIRAFREMASGAGASQAIVWIGRSLRDDEVLKRRFPEGEGVCEK